MKRVLKGILKWTLRAVLIVLLLTALWIFIAYWSEKNDCDRLTSAPANPMKAVVHCEYGIKNLQVRDLEKPAPDDNQLLVRVRAAALNPLDGHMSRGGMLGRAFGS